MSQELLYTFEEFNLIIRNILESENIDPEFQNHFPADWNSPFNRLRWDLYTYKSKPYVSIETFIDIVYRRHILNESVKVDSIFHPIAVGDIIITGSLTLYKILGFSTKRNTSVKVQNIYNNNISYKPMNAIVKMREINDI